MSTKKAQVWTTDFALSLLIFVVTIVMFGKAVMNVSSSTGENIDAVVSEARLISDSFVSTGYPDNWTASDVKRIGLMKSVKEIDTSKLTNFANMPYQDTRKIFGLKYDYFVFFIGEDGKLLNVTSRLGIGHPDVYAIISRSDNNKIAYYQKENLLLDEMQQLNATIYTGASKANFLSEINNYELAVMEDPHFSTTDIAVVENYVKNGGKLIITEHISTASGTFFGNNFVFRSMNAGNEQATVQENDTNSPFAAGETYTPREYPYVSGAKITELSEYPDGNAATSVWRYGNGKVYYFSDIDNPDYTGDFEENVKTLTSNFVNEYMPENYVDMSQVSYDKLVIITRLVVVDRKITKMVLYTWD